MDAVVALTVMCVLVFVFMPRQCEAVRVAKMLMWGTVEVWFG